MADNTVDDTMQNEQPEDTGVRRTGKKAEEKAKQKIKDARKKAAEKGKYAKGFGKIIWYFALVILIIIMVIGFISFAIHLPGLVVDKITNTMTGAGNAIKIIFTKKDLSNLKPEDLFEKKKELLTYLKDMGYDAVGMGFVQDVFESDGKITNFNEDIALSDNSSISIQPSYLFSYYLANERIYVPKKIKLLDKIFKNVGVNSNWGEGMLNFYGDQGAIDSEELDRENLTLTFKNTHGFFMTDVYQYNVDGWAGRYGTPLELLLAIHSSTMMPDLVYEFASNENLQTVVNIEAQEVALKVKLKLMGPDGEEDIYVGDDGNPAIPIQFERDKKTNQYKVVNIQEIKDGLKGSEYSLVSLYKGFEAFDETLNEQATIIGADATQTKIDQIINMNEQYFYQTYDPDSNRNSFGQNVLYGGFYLGSNLEVNDGAELYDGAVTINSVDKSNRKITYTEKFEDQDCTIDDTLCKSVALPHVANALKNQEQLFDWSDAEEFSNDWREQLKSNYRFIFQETDKYIQNLVDGGTVPYSNVIYITEDNYEKRFEKWVDEMQAPMKFDEYIENNGLQSLNQYEKEGKYKAYLSDWADVQVLPLRSILSDIDHDLKVERDLKAIADKLKEELANELGLTVEQVDVIYNKFILQEPDIRTFVPKIKSVVKHWYKDLVFQYKNTAKGSVFEAPYPGECVEGYNLYYQFETEDDNYPIQDGEPYVIKGDIVTQNGKQVDQNDIPVDNETQQVLSENNYTLGNGYKTARRLFTQGYYYQYDGSQETAKEIANAKRMEYYAVGTPIKIVVKNSRLFLVEQSTEYPIGTVIHRYADKNNVDVATKEQAENTYDTYYVAAPGPYYSAAKGNEALTKKTVEEINAVLKTVGTDVRRKKVTMSSNTTSLTALSMLEGMHSLDADYIYREFKEFLIELGYYSRAEIESVETNVLDWFIPAFTPDEWPPIKNDEEMLNYGITLYSSSNIKDKDVLKVDKVSSLDNFIFYSDIDGIYDGSVLQGNNVRFSNTVNSDAIVNDIVNTNPAAICLYVDANAKDDENAIVKTKKLLEEIRTKLKEKQAKSANLPIYVLQVLPLSQPDLFAEPSKEVVNQNKKISDYNVNLYSVCLNQDNVKFIDATSGCINNEGWLVKDFNSSKISGNIVNKIVKKNVSNGGFEEGLEVLTPGAGYIKDVTADTITIEFSVDKDHSLKSVDKFSMIISGISVDGSLTKGSEIARGTKIGVTTTNNIELRLRDRNKAEISNIEDYMGLPKGKNGESISEWEMLYFLPKESGALDRDGCGTESVEVGYDEVAIGIIQWTTTNDFNNVSKLCGKLAEKNLELCGGLQAFSSWTAAQVMSDIQSGDSSEIRQAFSSITDKDKEGFLALQVECMKEDYGGPPAGNEWILDRRGVVYGTYISGRLWAGVNCGIDQVINSNMTDEQLVSVILKKARDSKVGDLKENDSNYNVGWDNRINPNNPGSQMAVAMGILNGDYTEDEIESLVRNGY